MDDPAKRVFKDWPTNPIGLSGHAVSDGQVKKVYVTEPWMAEFVKERHSEEEWDGFFVYLQAGPIKRWFIWVGSYLYRAVPFWFRR